MRRCGERIAVGLHDRHLWAPLPACSISATSIRALRACAPAKLSLRPHNWTRHQGESEVVSTSDLAKVDGEAQRLAQKLELCEALRTHTLPLWAGLRHHKAGTLLQHPAVANQVRGPSEALNWYEAAAGCTSNGDPHHSMH